MYAVCDSCYYWIKYIIKINISYYYNVYVWYSITWNMLHGIHQNQSSKPKYSYYVNLKIFLLLNKFEATLSHWNNNSKLALVQHNIVKLKFKRHNILYAFASKLCTICATIVEQKSCHVHWFAATNQNAHQHYWNCCIFTRKFKCYLGALLNQQY